MKAKLVCKGSKVDVLVGYWEKMVFQMMGNAAPDARRGRPLDQGALDFVAKLTRVPEPIKRAMLAAYVAQCRRVHAIAFLQWRKKFPNDVRHDIDMLDSLEADGIIMIN